MKRRLDDRYEQKEADHLLEGILTDHLKNAKWANSRNMEKQLTSETKREAQTPPPSNDGSDNEDQASFWKHKKGWQSSEMLFLSIKDYQDSTELLE